MSTKGCDQNDATLRRASPDEPPIEEAVEMKQLSLLGVMAKGRYLIEKEIGRGGVGAVYLARDTHLLSRPVVIKVLLEESDQSEWFKKKFRQEMEALARIDHPGVVGVFDAGQLPDGKAFLVIQFIDGVSLRSLIRYEGMELDRVANIIRQVAHALSAAHDKGVIHRDLKPENIMLQSLGENEDQVKLIDFGLATVKDSQVASSRETTTVAGTVAYMAPEQLRGKPTASSDIYAMGVIAYEMVTGRRPFNPRSPYQLLEMQEVGVRVKPSDMRPGLPEAAQRAILKALSFHPKERHSRARTFGDELSQALIEEADQFITSSPASPAGGLTTRTLNQYPVTQEAGAPQSSLRIKKKGKLHATLAAVTLLIAVVAVTYYRTHFEMPARPLTTVEFSDEFLNLSRWTTPPSGWSVNKPYHLQIENQPLIGFPTGINYRDFTMHFHLTLLNAVGATWALRIKDLDNYYLFHLSGTDGLYPNRFITYIVRDGRFNPAVFELSTPVVAQLKADGQYEIDIKVEKDEITHQITPAETGELLNLGYYRDPYNIFPTGGIGFRTVGNEKFWISDLFVRPPEIELPQ